jgi:hypothetical protein
VAIKVLQRIGWTMIPVGIVLAVLFVSGLTHPVSAQVPSTIDSYNLHQRWVVVGFVVSILGAAILLVTEMFWRSEKRQEAKSSTSPAE